MNNTVCIATDAVLLAKALCSKLSDTDFNSFVVGTAIELEAKIKIMLPRYIFIEDCFFSHDTDIHIQQMAKQYRNTSIAVWSASEVSSHAAARFIVAGAESFFTLRDTSSNIKIIINKIVEGQHYYPADVEMLLERDNAYSEIGEELTGREIEIIKLTITGKTNKQIGSVLEISVHTVKFHKANIYRKCGGNTLIDILRNGLIKGIINQDDLI
jgi:DNA-binding NarL/FixJ family response regulator